LAHCEAVYKRAGVHPIILNEGCRSEGSTRSDFGVVDTSSGKRNQAKIDPL
jgi:hypothetical protein